MVRTDLGCATASKARSFIPEAASSVLPACYKLLSNNFP